MQNKHSSDGIAEDLIRSLVQMASVELHTKTLIEKRISEIENGMINEEDIPKQLEIIQGLKEDIGEQAEVRRSIMLYLYNLYGQKGNKEYWCLVKHYSMAMYTMFESWQASERDEELLSMAIQINKMFIKALTCFLGVEITECSSCFSDILKAELKENGNVVESSSM